MKGSTIATAMSVIAVLTLVGGARAPRTSQDNPTPVTEARAGTHGAAASANMRLPLHFEFNGGQSAPEVMFTARGRGYGLFLTATGAVLALPAPAAPEKAQSIPAVVRMTFAGANPAPVVSGVDELPGKAHYFRGRDPKTWRANIPTYARVQYRDLYPGVNLVYYGNDEQQLEYDLLVEPGGNPKHIVLSFDGVEGLDLTPAGDLLLRAGGREIVQRKPVIYQQRGDGSARQSVAGGYVLRDERHAAFDIGPYDTTKELVIDPVVTFASYLGGARRDGANRVAVDTSGNAYITGSTTSGDFPVTSGAISSESFDDVFVTKVAGDGSALIYSVYLGGAGVDSGEAIAVDGAGRACLTGLTLSADFPIVDGVQSTFGGPAGDAFVARLSPAGDALLYSTYLGGGGIDIGRGIAIDLSGSMYVTGATRSTDFPVVNAFQPQLAGIDPSVDAFVTKFSPDGGSLVYSTFLGGGESDSGNAIAVNWRGQAHVAGVTASADFPTFRPFQSTALRGTSEAFVTKLARDGSSLVYSSNLGGDRLDNALDIVVDWLDRASVVGLTMSTDFPTMRPLKAGLSGTTDTFDAFVTTVSPAGATLMFSTYLGGTSRDEAHGVAVDFAANLYVIGRTFSTDFPVVDPVQAAPGGGMDTFVAKIEIFPRRPRIVYATYFGGEGDDDPGGVAVDLAGSAYVVGTTVSDGFPVVNARQPLRAGDFDAYFAKIARR
jgi:hypothetical protein